MTTELVFILLSAGIILPIVLLKKAASPQPQKAVCTENKSTATGADMRKYVILYKDEVMCSYDSYLEASAFATQHYEPRTYKIKYI